MVGFELPHVSDDQAQVMSANLPRRVPCYCFEGVVRVLELSIGIDDEHHFRTLLYRVPQSPKHLRYRPRLVYQPKPSVPSFEICMRRDTTGTSDIARGSFCPGYDAKH